MGNLIKDFWTYTYKEKQWFGMIEVIKGEDLAQNRNTKKYETHIERALDFTMKNKVMSHMSIQTFCTKLNDRPSREDNEQRYYPFVLEFESRDKNKYEDVVYEVAIYVNYLVTQYNINKDDILIMMNNSKSLYVFVNPKSFGAKPNKDQHKIYFEMYKQFKKDLSLKYVDESIVASSYKVMKTPNSYYKGGFFVPVTIDEIMKLLTGVYTKKQLTGKRRSLDKDVPGQISMRASRLYSNAVKSVRFGRNVEEKEYSISNNGCGKCVQYLLQHMIEEGYRNFGLVSVAIYLKSLGYTAEEVEKNLIDLAASWNHDENERAIKSKVKSVFKRNYKFSCKYVKSVLADLDVENMCSKCPYNKQNKLKIVNGISIDQKVINSLWQSNASTRHYLLYLELVKKNLINREFNAASEGINERTLRELCNHAFFTKVKGENGISINYRPSKSLYKLPKEFDAAALGESLKPYLKLFVKGYRANDKYIMIRSNIETIQDDLGYNDISSVYKLFKKLSDIGMVKYFSRTSTLNMYYESYKVIDINKNITETDSICTGSDKNITKSNNNITPEEEQKVAVGEQISLLESGIYPQKNVYKRYFKMNRGSPPT